VVLTQSPPETVGGILMRLGPGLIIAASIVGSGELIATTKVGAEAGVWLLWLIIIGCMIKVFAQVEFGRFAISEGRGTMEAMNLVPGPRLRVNWLVWYWVIMFAASLGQLGGIVGMVGQSLSIAAPITGDFKQALFEQKAWDDALHERYTAADLLDRGLAFEEAFQIRRQQARVALEAERGQRPDLPKDTRDDVYWSGLVTLVTAVLLVLGRYGLVQSIATVMVAGFTLVTIVNLFALQTHEAWATTWEELAAGLSFRLPPPEPGLNPVVTALAAFGIIGVGAAELITYPYWCLEKGYARFTGPREPTETWAQRARGWLRVMRWDAWCSMVIYTFATVAFYLLGANVLHRSHKNPTDQQVVPTLMSMYEPVFGPAAAMIFLVGAFAVLYSTFFVAIAGHTRTVADAVRVFRFGAWTPEAFRWWVKLLSGILPFVSLSIYVWNKSPVTMVLLSGLAQAIMLPMLGAAALFYRFRRCDPRITPGRLWDAFLWTSVLGLLVTGLWSAWKPANDIGRLVYSWLAG
jgi:Mn2+/Fe2+ NRAMP family transporter